MKKPAKYFVNYDPFTNTYKITGSCHYSRNDWGYYEMEGKLYSPKANLVFDSLKEAQESLKTARKEALI